MELREKGKLRHTHACSPLCPVLDLVLSWQQRQEGQHQSATLASSLNVFWLQDRGMQASKSEAM